MLLHADLLGFLRMGRGRNERGNLKQEAGEGSFSLFTLHIVHLSCAAFSRYCSAVAFTVVRFCDVPSLSLSLTASMVDTMLPLLNWTFHFISVGRSKGRDDFIFLIITLNLPSEIFMSPRGIVDSDEYSPDSN